MDSHDRLLAGFLAGELDSAEARRWDEHLLECEACWRAVREDLAGRQAAQVLRQPAPPGWPTGSRSRWRWPPLAGQPRRGAPVRRPARRGGHARVAGRGWREPGQSLWPWW